MPENEFEKQVKELMEELRFSPSAPVWEKIKKSIGKKKRRVWPIFFLFLSIIIVSGYFFYSDIKHADKNFTKKAGTNKTASTNNSTTKKLSDSISLQKINKKDSAFITQSQQQLSAIKKINKTNTIVTVNNLKNNAPVYDQALIKKNSIEEIVDTSTYKKAFSDSQTFIPNNNITITQQPLDSNNIFKNNVVSSNTDSLSKMNNETKIDSTTATNKKPAAKNIKNRKWQWGITAMYGYSTLSDNLLAINTDKSLSTNAVSPGGYPPAVKNPYNTNTAYSFGIAVQRKILKRSSLNTGINFVYLSAKSNTALRLDSSLAPYAFDVQNSNLNSNFYRLGSAKTYTSDFNFIEIPVTFQSSLFHVHNFSVLYNGGFSVMQLISSKTLVYNNNNNNFFKDDDLLRRTQLQLKAGLNFGLKLKNSNILLGPNFSYSISPYLNDNNYSRLHFINYGLQASWLFNKK